MKEGIFEVYMAELKMGADRWRRILQLLEKDMEGIEDCEKLCEKIKDFRASVYDELTSFRKWLKSQKEAFLR